MKDYNTLSLKALAKQKRKIADGFNREIRASTAQGRHANYEPYIAARKQVEDILAKRTGTPLRCSLTKRIQRKMGLLPPV